MGETWREFLWQNLLATPYPMMDVILDRFGSHNELGIVFAQDPHLSDWNDNLKIATDLANRIAIPVPLPLFLRFSQRNDVLVPACCIMTIV
jgi:Rhamnan synthesis protein F